MVGTFIAALSFRNPASVSTNSAVAAFDGLYTDRAVTWKGPPLIGAVYSPSLVMVPPAGPSSTLQVTPFDTVPCTSTVNCRCFPRGNAFAQLMYMPTSLTVTSAVADLLGSAMLVATTCTSIAFAGAV